MRTLLLSVSFLLLAACGHGDPPPPYALDRTCDTGGRHGPSGVMDYACVDGDGVQRLPVESLHRVIAGDHEDHARNGDENSRQEDDDPD